MSAREANLIFGNDAPVKHHIQFFAITSDLMEVSDFPTLPLIFTRLSTAYAKAAIFMKQSTDFKIDINQYE
jgi:hypothetical protein